MAQLHGQTESRNGVGAGILSNPDRSNQDRRLTRPLVLELREQLFHVDGRFAGLQLA